MQGTLHSPKGGKKMNGGYDVNQALQSLFQMKNAGRNPQQIMQSVVQQNPQIQVLLNQAQQSGMTPQQYAMQYAKQNNINIQPLINMFAQRGIRL